jgi:hypothetical protein
LDANLNVKISNFDFLNSLNPCIDSKTVYTHPFYERKSALSLWRQLTKLEPQVPVSEYEDFHGLALVLRMLVSYGTYTIVNPEDVVKEEAFNYGAPQNVKGNV